MPSLRVLIAGAALRASTAYEPFGVAPTAVDCSFAASYPRQYVAYHLENATLGALTGDLSKPAWAAVAFTDSFVDIATPTAPQFRTRAKIRWDDAFLYVAADVEDEVAWANITSTCHCVDPAHDQVIFHDNDFEIFVDADGSTHAYKEYEMNCLNATWDLSLNKPYDDGGSENSSRVFGPAGWDYPPPIGGPRSMHAGAFVRGVPNNPAAPARGWTVEVALPLASLAENTTAAVPPAPGSFWRINFSRVEWAVKVVDGGYQKFPSCQSCAAPGSNAEDDWVWSPMGSVAMHLPEKWGFLQFARGAVNATPAVVNGEWPVRAHAAALYYAEHAFAAAHNGSFTARAADLAPYVADAALLDGSCSGGAPLSLALVGSGFVATVPPSPFGNQAARATITNDRLLRVETG